MRDVGEEEVIVGDLNVHVENFLNSRAISFNCIIEEMGWNQLVTGQTHSAAHTLDLALSRTGGNFIIDVSLAAVVSNLDLVIC